MPKVKLTQKKIEDVLNEPMLKSEAFYWDMDCPNLALRRRAASEATFIFQYKDKNLRTRRILIGKVLSVPLIEARKRAKKLHADIVNHLDPAAARSKKRREISVAELCDLYLKEGVGHKKASTVESDICRIERHIKPLLGSHPVSAVTLGMVERFMRDVAEGRTRLDRKTRRHGRSIVRGGKGAASRTVALLGGIFTYAKRQGYVEINPVHGVKRPKDRQLGLLLTKEQIGKLLECLGWLHEREVNPVAIYLIELILLTGRRSGELETLKWDYVREDINQLWLPDTKTGALKVECSSIAMQTISKLKAFRRQGNPYVFPAITGEGYYVGLPKIWEMVRKYMNMPNLRVHDLRHNFASWLVLMKVPLPIVSRLLGHRDPRTTNRYLHLDPAFVKSAAEDVGQFLIAPQPLPVEPPIS